MIDWSSPDYTSAGHYYALIQSINITCADPSTPAADVTSYVYGGNSSAMTPSVTFSNASTTNGAMGTMASVSGVWGVWTITCAVLFSLLGAALA